MEMWIRQKKVIFVKYKDEDDNKFLLQK